MARGMWIPLVYIQRENRRIFTFQRFTVEIEKARVNSDQDNYP